jgi:hypothetical protein
MKVTGVVRFTWEQMTRIASHGSGREHVKMEVHKSNPEIGQSYLVCAFCGEFRKLLPTPS